MGIGMWAMASAAVCVAVSLFFVFRRWRARHGDRSPSARKRRPGMAGTLHAPGMPAHGTSKHEISERAHGCFQPFANDVGQRGASVPASKKTRRRAVILLKIASGSALAMLVLLLVHAVLELIRRRAACRKRRLYAFDECALRPARNGP
jgi:hypothetical protein